jgi:hypothetical protein
MSKLDNVLVIAPVVTVDIITLRGKAIEAETTNYGARRNYANGINEIAMLVTPNIVNPEHAWYNLEGDHNLPKAIKDEKSEYYKALTAIKYPNNSNAWKMIKKYAKEDAVSRGLFGETPSTPNTSEGEGEGEGNGARANEAKVLNLFMVETLTNMHKRALRTKQQKPEQYGEKQSNAHAKVIEALKALGVDIGLIK